MALLGDNLPLRRSHILVNKSGGDTREMAHQFGFDLRPNADTINRHIHAAQPGILLRRADRDMGMHLPDVGMMVPLYVEFRATEETGQEIELFDPRMGNAMTAQMQQQEWPACIFGFDDIIERVDQPADSGLAAQSSIERRNFHSPAFSIAPSSMNKKYSNYFFSRNRDFVAAPVASISGQKSSGRLRLTLPRGRPLDS